MLIIGKNFVLPLIPPYS